MELAREQPTRQVTIFDLKTRQWHGNSTRFHYHHLEAVRSQQSQGLVLKLI